MKITLIIEHFDPTRGGAEQFTVWLAGELAKRGHEVHVICHDVASRINKYRQATQRASHDAGRSYAAFPNEDDVVMKGVHIHKMKGMRLNTGLGLRLFGRKVSRFLQRHSPDVVHSMTVACAGDIYHPHTGVYAEIQKQAIASRRTPAAANLKRLMLQFSSKQRTLLGMERRAARPRREGGPSRIISLCPMIAEHFHKHYGLDPRSEHFVELPNPLMRPPGGDDAVKVKGDRAWFRGHYGLKPDDRVALFVGHDFRRKGLEFAIEAVARTKEWKLLVVGLGKAREYVELANSLGIGDEGNGGRRVLFVGPTKEMERVYAAADALMLPTFYDPFALVVLESLSYGMPVISTDFLGAAYLVKDYHAGTIVPGPRDVELMAKALERLPVTGSPELEKLAKSARAAAGRMKPGTYMDELLAVYKQVAHEKKGR